MVDDPFWLYVGLVAFAIIIFLLIANAVSVDSAASLLSVFGTTREQAMQDFKARGLH